MPTANTKIEFSCKPFEGSQVFCGCRNTDGGGRFYVSYESKGERANYTCSISFGHKEYDTFK